MKDFSHSGSGKDTLITSWQQRILVYAKILKLYSIHYCNINCDVSKMSNFMQIIVSILKVLNYEDLIPTPVSFDNFLIRISLSKSNYDKLRNKIKLC